MGGRMRGMVCNTILLIMRHKLGWIRVLRVYYSFIGQIKTRPALRDLLELAFSVSIHHWGRATDG